MMTKTAALLLILISLSLKATITSSNLFTLSSLSSQTNTGTATQLGSVVLPQTTFAIQSFGTGGTNFGLSGTILFGTSTNVASMTPVGFYRATNDTIVSFTITNNGILPAYFAFQAANTNSTAASLGCQAIQNK